MKRLGLRIVLLAGLMAWSCAAVWGQDLSLRALHYWDKYNLSDSTFYRPVAGDDSFSAMETEAANFFALLKNVPDSAARIAVGNYLDKAALASRDGFDAYGHIMGIAEKYFYNVNSPYYNENMLLPFLDHKIARADIPEVEKSREKYLAMIIRHNAVGSKAEDFWYADYDVVNNLSGIFQDWRDFKDALPPQYRNRGMEMLVFLSGDCRECKDGIERLGNSPVVKRLCESFVMGVTLLCIDGFYPGLRREFDKKYKHLGIVYTDRSNIVENSLYSIRHSPSVYILDMDGVVLLKDASVSSAIQFLLEQ